MGRATCVALGLLAVCGGDQPLVAQALPGVPAYDIRAFGVRDGLPLSEVVGMAEGPDGYLYVATGGGLARFDGSTFQEVPTPGLGAPLWMYGDRTGRLWVMSQGNRLGLLEHGRFRLLPPVPGYDADANPMVYGRQIRSLSETNDGSVWLGGYEGLVWMSGDSPGAYRHFTAADGLPSDTVVGVFDAAPGEQIVVTQDRLARVVPGNAPGSFGFSAFGPHCRLIGDVRVVDAGIRSTCGEPHRPEAVLEYRSGAFRSYPLDEAPRRIELASGSTVSSEGAPPGRPFRGGAFFQDGVDWERLGLVSDGLPVYGRDLIAGDGTRWLTGWAPNDRPAVLARVRAGTIDRVPIEETQEFVELDLLFEDREGSLWVGTDRGIMQVTERVIRVLDDGDGSANGFFMPVLEDREGSVWVGSWGGGLRRFAEGGLVRRYDRADGLPSPNVRGLYEARDGTIWVGTERGLAAIRQGRVDSTHPTGWEVRAIAESDDGRLLVAGQDGLVGLASEGAPVSEGDLIDGGDFWALHTASDGTVWAGSRDGLLRMDEAGAEWVGGEGGPASTWVVSIAEESDGTLWVGTYADGLFRHRDGRFARLGVADGLPAPGTWSVVDDGLGFVWLTSDRGLLRVSLARLHEVADLREAGRPEGQLDGILFTEAQGLPSREFNRASPAGVRLGDGRLVFNNMDGVIVVDPARVPDLPAPVTAVVAITADGQGLSTEDGPVAVPAGTRHLVVDLSAVTFRSDVRPEFRYRVEGYDPGWIEGGTVARASYTGLGPGRYEFRAQASTRPGVWSEPVHVPLVVAPLLWQAWWFRLGVAGLVVSLLWGAHHYRTRRLLEVARLRTRIASDLHDDIGASLSSIAMLSDMLSQRGRLEGKERRQIERIGAAATDTIEGLRDVIWLVDPRHDNLRDLVRKLREVAADLLVKFRWDFVGAEAVGDHALAPHVVRTTLLLFKEALHNVARHSEAEHVVIEVGTAGGRLRLSIADDGRGFEESRIRPGRGLDGMRRRAEEAGGALDVTSAPGGGTRIEFEVEMA